MENRAMNPQVEASYDPVTGTVSYLVYDHRGGRVAIVDPVLGYDAASGRTDTALADRLAARVQALDLTLDWILETHAHADHLSAAHHLRQRLGGRVAIGANIVRVQGLFKQVFSLETGFAEDGSQFDRLFADGETFRIGLLQGEVLAVPGHTPADVAYRIGDAVFVGDTLFMPDVGTARCDFPGGDAHLLYTSIRRLLALPPATRLYMCHDYPPAGRTPAWECSVSDQRQRNIHVRDGIGEEQFVAMRTARDAGLALPTLILPSVQVNIRAGALPEPEGNGRRYLKIPLNTF
jgi:glyoxylase-like metal-dependent hydrolase (beta-lactamase superfamily II)